MNTCHLRTENGNFAYRRTYDIQTTCDRKKAVSVRSLTLAAARLTAKAEGRMRSDRIGTHAISSASEVIVVRIGILGLGTAAHRQNATDCAPATYREQCPAQMLCLHAGI